MIRKIVLLTILLMSVSSHSQNKCTLNVKNHGFFTKPGFLKDGIRINLPNEYMFYMIGERVILGIENFDSIAQFRGVEDGFSRIYQDKLCDHMTKKGEDCGDTEVSYEIHNSPMFGYCRIVYFYYESGLSTNSISSMWSSIGDGEHTIVIISDDKVYYTRKIRIVKGNLVNR
jgi:hypothetical protein